MPHTPLMFLPFPRDLFFVAREADLLTLDKQLQHHHFVTISAPGGVGKTALALEYAYRFSSDYPCIFWLNASSRESLLADYYDLSRFLDLPLKAEPMTAPEHAQTAGAQAEQRDPDGQQAPDEQQTKPVSQDQPQQQSSLTLPDWLARVRQYLLILDDLQNPALLQEIFPASLSGHILITTRSPELALPQSSTSLALARLDIQDSALLLQNLSGQTFSPQTQDPVVIDSRLAFIRLARELSGQPLALMLAGLHIKTSGVSFARFLQDYQASLADLPPFQERSDGFSRELAALVPLLVTFLQQHYPHSRNILEICAFLAPTAIPALLFASIDTDTDAIAPADATSWRADVDVLLASGLLTSSLSKQMVSLHPLLQQAIQDILPMEHQRSLVTQALHQLFHLSPAGTRLSALRLRLLAHIYHCALLSEPWSFASADIARTFAWAAAALEQEDSLSAALFLRSKALAIWERVPAVKPIALISLRQKQVLLAQRLENYVEAESLLRQSIADCLACYGGEHPITIVQLLRLARTYLARRSDAEAEACYKKALMLSQSGHNQSDQLVIPIQYELALFYVRTSDFSSAEYLLREVHNVCKRQFGANHPETLKHARELGVASMMVHKWSKAEVLFQQISIAYENDPAAPLAEALQVWHYLALTLTAQARWDAAITIYQRILDRLVETRDRLHPDLLPYLTELSHIYQVQKDKQAEKQATLSWCQEIREAQLAHPQDASPQEVLDNLNALGALYLGQRRYVEAERLFLRSLLLSNAWQIRDPRQLAVNLSALTVAQIAQDQARIPQATLSMQAALTAWQHVLGPDHPEFVALNRQYQQWIQQHPV